MTTYLSHFVNTFDETHVMAVKCVLRYLIRMHNLVICYDKQLTNSHDMMTLLPVGYADADWGSSDAD